MGKNEKTVKDELSKSREIKIDVEQKREHNEYYGKVSNRYRTLKFFALGALVLYLVGMLVIHRSQITYENLVYLMKDLDTDVDATGTVFREIKYDESMKLSGDVFKGYFAAATTGSFTLFNTTGSAEREYQISMENPKVLTGEKYVMVYDVGGNSYSLYTSIVNVLTKQTGQVLQGAALSDSGSFALISRVYKDKYVMDAALSSDGTRYAIASCEVAGSDLTCEIMSGRCDSEESRTVTVEGAMPLKTGFFSDGSFCVVCDDKACFFTEDGSLAAEKELGGYGISGVSFSRNNVMIVESDNIVESRNTVTVYDGAGNTVCEYHTDSRVGASALGDGLMFFASDGKLSRVDFEGKADVTDCSLSVSFLVPFSDNVLVCTPKSAVTGFTQIEASEEYAGEESGSKTAFDSVND